MERKQEGASTFAGSLPAESTVQALEFAFHVLPYPHFGRCHGPFMARLRIKAAYLLLREEIKKQRPGEILASAPAARFAPDRAKKRHRPHLPRLNAERLGSQHPLRRSHSAS